MALVNSCGPFEVGKTYVLKDDPSCEFTILEIDNQTDGKIVARGYAYGNKKLKDEYILRRLNPVPREEIFK